MIYSQKPNKPPVKQLEAKTKEVFSNEMFGELTVIKNEKDEIFFIGKEVAEKLAYSNPNEAIEDHVRDKYKIYLDSQQVKKLNSELLSSFGQRGGWIINEAGLYSLVLKSKLESAEKFQDWVVEEVLPSIRKRGMYATDDVVDKFLADPDFAIKLLTEYKEEKQKRLEAQKLQKEAESKYKEAEDRLDILIHNDKTYTATQIAKECGFRSAIMFNRFLFENKIQYRKDNMWLAYAKYVELGYFEQKQQIVPHKKKPVYFSKITQTGREFLLKFVKQKASN